MSEGWRCELCGAGIDRSFPEPLPKLPQLITCQECGMVSLAYFPDPLARAQAYQAAYYDPVDSSRFLGPLEVVVRFFRWLRWRELSRLKLPRPSFLDVGCGRGLLVECFAKAGVAATGTQLSQTAAQVARQRGLDVRVGELEQLALPAEGFGLITFYHVLEHVADPLSTLREATRLLAPGGFVVVEVPNYASWGFRWLGLRNVCVDYPHHLFFFTPATLHRHFAAVGLEIESESHLSWEYSPITTLQNVLNLAPGRPNRLLDSLRNTPEGRRLRRDPTSWAHWLLALVLAPITLVASLSAAVARAGNTYRVTGRKPLSVT